MKMLKKVLPLAVAAALAATTGMAAVTASHHDLDTWTGGTTEEVCLYCHGVTSTVTNVGYGEIGDLCVSRCHLGAAGYAGTADPIPNRPGSISEAGAYIAPVATLDAVNVTDGYAHGLDRNDLYTSFGGGAPLGFDAIGEALPYTDASGTTDMQCTSCHNVHDYTNTPFLQAHLFAGGPGGESFCEACHTARGNSWIGGETAPNGEHPVNFALVLGDSGRRDLRHQRRHQRRRRYR